MTDQYQIGYAGIDLGGPHTHPTTKAMPMDTKLVDHAREAAEKIRHDDDCILYESETADDQLQVEAAIPHIQQAIDAATATQRQIAASQYDALRAEKDAEIAWLKRVREEQTANLGTMARRIAALERVVEEYKQAELNSWGAKQRDAALAALDEETT